MAGIVKIGSKIIKPNKALFSLTSSAKTRLRHLITNHKTPAAGIRVGVKKGGCNGYVYTMTFAEKVLPTDEIVKDEDITVIVDPKAVFAITGTEMDYVTSKLKSEFVFTNPNAKGTCGCGESFSTL